MVGQYLWEKKSLFEDNIEVILLPTFVVLDNLYCNTY